MKKRLLLIIGLVLALALTAPTAVFADGPNDSKDSKDSTIQLNPTFLVQAPDCIVVSFSAPDNAASTKAVDKAAYLKQIDAYVAKMNADMFAKQPLSGGAVILSGSGYNSMYQQRTTPYGNGQCNSTFTTNIAWATSTAVSYGTSNATWTGTNPNINCSFIMNQHTLGCSAWTSAFAAPPPTGWWIDPLNGSTSAYSPAYYGYNTTYLSTGWYGLNIAYIQDYQTLSQTSQMGYAFSDGFGPNVYISQFMPYAY